MNYNNCKSVIDQQMSSVTTIFFIKVYTCALQTFHLNTTSHLSPSQPTVLNEAARKNVELLQVTYSQPVNSQSVSCFYDECAQVLAGAKIRVATVREKLGKNKNFSRSGKSRGIL